MIFLQYYSKRQPNILSVSDSISIFSNPAKDNITIEIQQQDVQSVIEISTIQGQLIKTIATTANKTNIDVSAIPRTIYIVKVISEKSVWINKFVKE